MTMQFPFEAAQENAIDPNLLTEVKRFISDNADELVLVAGAAGGHNCAAAAKDLVDTALSGDAPADLLCDLLIVVRDALRDSSGSARTCGGPARPDLSAAIRWFGARLDDLIRPMA